MDLIVGLNERWRNGIQWALFVFRVNFDVIQGFEQLARISWNRSETSKGNWTNLALYNVIEKLLPHFLTNRNPLLCINLQNPHNNRITVIQANFPTDPNMTITRTKTPHNPMISLSKPSHLVRLLRWLSCLLVQSCKISDVVDILDCEIVFLEFWFRLGLGTVLVELVFDVLFVDEVFVED